MATAEDVKARHAFEEHTSEVRMRIVAPSLRELFAEAGRGLAELFVGTESLPAPSSERENVTLEAIDENALLVIWLNELIFRTELHRKIFTEFHFSILSAHDLWATIRGAKVDEVRTFVKATSLTGVTIEEGSHGLVATVVFDV